ncbi:hypothetical protein BJ170DRAFT_410577 [Xylariales sp. AK1849]|nr:hypothetical protein BJ170DRAFT_410577 [Xylariales sp. AK1849]
MWGSDAKPSYCMYYAVSAFWVGTYRLSTGGLPHRPLIGNHCGKFPFARRCTGEPGSNTTYQEYRSVSYTHDLIPIRFGFFMQHGRRSPAGCMNCKSPTSSSRSRSSSRSGSQPEGSTAKLVLRLYPAAIAEFLFKCWGFARLGDRPSFLTPHRPHVNLCSSAPQHRILPCNSICTQGCYAMYRRYCGRHMQCLCMLQTLGTRLQDVSTSELGHMYACCPWCYLASGIGSE